MVPSQRIESFGKSDEVTRDQPRSLVNQLVEGMLTICSRLPPIDRSRRIIDSSTLERHVLTVTFHRQLLQIRRESFQVLFIGQHRNRFGLEKIVVPEGEEAQKDGPVFLEWCGTEVCVHFVKTVEKSPES